MSFKVSFIGDAEGAPRQVRIEYDQDELWLAITELPLLIQALKDLDMREIQPCVCGQLGVLEPFTDEGVSVKCPSCGITGLTYDSRNGAVSSWNLSIAFRREARAAKGE